MPHINHNPFAHLRHLPLADIEEEVRRSLLSNQLMPRLNRKPCGEIDIPMRGESSSETNSQNSQIAESQFNFSYGAIPDSFVLSREALERVDEQLEHLKRESMQRLEYLLHRSCLPLGELGFSQIRLSSEAERCVTSVALSLNITTDEAFQMCDRFVSRHRMSWEMLAQFLADGRIRRFDNELALVMQLPTPANPRFIGDATYEFNARSPHIRCAVNPCGPCEGCIHKA